MISGKNNTLQMNIIVGDASNHKSVFVFFSACYMRNAKQ